MPFSPSDESTPEFNTDADSTAAAALLDVEADPTTMSPEWTGPRCEQCSAPLKSEAVTICRHCGWYASLGLFVELDQDWEVDSDEDQPPPNEKRPSHVEVWLNLLPWWAWVVIATVAAIVLESAAVRLVTSEGSPTRTIWSLAQLGVGLLALAGCHVFNFLILAAADAEIGALDIFLKPLKLWLRVFAKLPERLWMTNTAAAALTAIVMSLVVIGGLPYERLWDWGFEKPTNRNLLGAVASRLQEVEGKGADNLEDAVSDFAGSQNLDANDAKPTPPPPPRKRVDCVIFGYRVDGQGRLLSLVLGTAHRGKLVYACSVLPKMSDAELRELIQTLTAAPAKQPLLSVQIEAKWIQPRYSCRVSYEEQSANGRLLNPQWEEMLGELGMN